MDKTRQRWLSVIQRKEDLSLAHNEKIKKQLEKRFTRERENNKRMADDREYWRSQIEEKAAKSAGVLQNKHKMEQAFSATMRE